MIRVSARYDPFVLRSSSLGKKRCARLLVVGEYQVLRYLLQILENSSQQKWSLPLFHILDARVVRLFSSYAIVAGLELRHIVVACPGVGRLAKASGHLKIDMRRFGDGKVMKPIATLRRGPWKHDRLAPACVGRTNVIPCVQPQMPFSPVLRHPLHIFRRRSP
jgi:hypothetical protein